MTEVVSFNITWYEGCRMSDIERTVILTTLEHYNGNRSRTARQLDLSLRTIKNKIKEYKQQGFAAPDPQNPSEYGKQGGRGRKKNV